MQFTERTNFVMRTTCVWHYSGYVFRCRRPIDLTPSSSLPPQPQPSLLVRLAHPVLCSLAARLVTHEFGAYCHILTSLLSSSSPTHNAFFFFSEYSRAFFWCANAFRFRTRTTFCRFSGLSTFVSWTSRQATGVEQEIAVHSQIGV